MVRMGLVTNKQENIFLNSLINNSIEFIIKYKKKILIILGIILAPFMFILSMVTLYMFLSLFIENNNIVFCVQLFIVLSWAILIAEWLTPKIYNDK